jgi:arylsulfatase A-like enzyme
MTAKRLQRLMFVGLVASAMQCGGRERPLNVIIMGVDTLRPDHLSCYGYQRKTSPNMDRFAAGGVLFLHNVSQAPWTLPSFASLLTSLYPHQHGASTGLSQVRTGFPTLGSILIENGYATAAMVNSRVLNPELRLDRGFEFYSPPGPEPRLADEDTRQALAWIDQQTRPFFLFLHYFDPHEPYAPPAPYDTLYDPGYTGFLERKAFVLQDEFPEVLSRNYERMDAATPRDWAHVNALYDGEITFTDVAIGEMVKGLEKRGLLKRTLLILIGDHGEEFYEHKGFGHGHSLHSEVINVPLIFSLPGRIPSNKRVPDQTRTIDVMPTILDLLGIKTAARFEGTSLVPLLTGGGRAAGHEGALFPPSLAYTEGILHGNQKASLTARPWKMICDIVTNEESFFNIEDDPGEQRPLADRSSEAYRAVSEVLLRSLLRTSDTWYIEMASSARRESFEVGLSVKEEPFQGSINLWRFMDRNGRFVDRSAAGQASTSEWALRIEGIRPDDKVTLAFKANAPPAIGVSFDLKIDGAARPGQIFIGEAGRNPEKVPFARKTGQMGARTWGAPAQKPAPPYFLVWRERGRQVGEIPATLTEDAKRELRALGYIQ